MTDIDQQSDNAAQQQQLVQAWLHAPVPRFYANGLAIANTASDLAVILSLNGAPNAIVNLSLITAKSLATELTKAVSDLENATKQRVQTINEMAEILTAVKGPGITSTK
jgi:hypothetical protein